MMAKPEPVELLALYGISPNSPEMLPMYVTPRVKPYGRLPLSVIFSMDESEERMRGILEVGRAQIAGQVGQRFADSVKLCRVRVEVLEVLE